MTLREHLNEALEQISWAISNERTVPGLLAHIHHAEARIKDALRELDAARMLATIEGHRAVPDPELVWDAT